MGFQLALDPITRGEFVRLTGLGECTARKVLAQLLADGLLTSDTPKGPVRDCRWMRSACCCRICTLRLQLARWIARREIQKQV
jgi:hypothetical protein